MNRIEKVTEAGYFVFPVTGKRPYKGFHWREESSDASAKIEEWKIQYPGCGWALDCGKSGLIVVDIDMPDGPVNWALAEIDETGAVIQNTPSGGRHVIFSAGIHTNIGQRSPFKSIDIRANGGFIVIVPSAGYSWEGKGLGFDWATNTNVKPALVPEKLLKLLTKTFIDDKEDSPSPAAPQGGGLSPYVLAALTGELARLEACEEGERNITLNKVVYSLSQFIEAGELDEGVLNEVREIARQKGLPDTEIENTIISARTAGGKSERHTPVHERKVRGVEERECKGITLIQRPKTKELVTLESIASLYENITWSWDGWIPNGFITMLAASQGMGKSLFALQVAGCFTNGWDWPDGTPFDGEQGKVLWIEGEESERLNIERAKSWGLNLSEVLMFPPDKFFAVTHAEQVEILNKTMERDDIVLLIVDSLSGVHTADEQSSSMMDVMRTFVAPLKKYDKAGIVTHHLRKVRQGELDIVTLDRIRGSSGIPQLARSVVGIDTPDGNIPNWKRVIQVKNNITIESESYGITHTTNKGLFERTENCPRVEKAFKDRTAGERSVDFLMGLFTESDRIPAAEIFEQGEAVGHNKRTLQRAKKRLELVTIWDSEKECWCWTSDESSPSSEDSLI